MNPVEAVQIVGIVRALCPAQKFDRMTPDAWQIVLSDVRLEDAQLAVRSLYRDFGNDEEFGPRRIEADDILRQVRRLRAERIAAHPELVPPFFDSVAEDIAWRRDALRRIGDGEVIPNDLRGVLVARDMKAIGGAA